ncbi:MAG: dimethylsulfonioproprionate lyase DddP [Pseudomonadota bacterium]
MNQHFSDTRKINPVRPDGSPDDNDRAEIGPTPLAFQEWAAAGLQAPSLAGMRAWRHRRLVSGINRRDYGGALFFDPLNIRYATDSSNMQLWNTHNAFRAVFVGADGHMVLFDYKGAANFLSDFNPLINEVRGGASMFYFVNGDKEDEDAGGFAAEIRDLIVEHGGGNMRLAIDKIAISGFRAFSAAGFEIEHGEELSEKSRAIKGPDEIKAMRCCIHSTEVSIGLMEQAAAPGMTEDDVWAVMHAENIRRGGEWIECRLLASGPRTYPWFQECGPRIIQNNEIIGYDTDLVGPYGLCADLSRTFWIGDKEPPQDIKDAFRFAVDHIHENTELLAPGKSLKEITFGGHQLEPEWVDGRYSCKMHGVGLCDEWPMIVYPEDWREGAFDYVLEPGMMLCVEALIGSAGLGCSIKLEDQVLITEDGVENMTKFPFDNRLLN